MRFIEIVKLAVQAIRGNLLRSSLTFTIIAIGIMALVGILTATDSIKASLNNSLSRLGANTFSVSKKGGGPRRGNDSKKYYPDITFDQAIAFKERLTFPAKVSLSARAGFAMQVKYQSEKTNPNVMLSGIDDFYLENTAYEVDLGRNFSSTELKSGRNVAIIGADLAETLFKNRQKIINSSISIGTVKYTVVGLLKEKGSSMAFSGDNMVFIPLVNAKKIWMKSRDNYGISVNVDNVEALDAAISEATGLFRSIRKIPLGIEDDFEMERSDNSASNIIESLAFVTLGAFIIGLITLFGAAIALLNIMLVSVKERTREIGVSKSLGATKSSIRYQFLVEAIVICQIGGALGVFFGILMGNIVSLFMGSSFIIPWVWMIMGFIFCFIVGLVAGIYPAYKASNLDPIESLRYE